MRYVLRRSSNNELPKPSGVGRTSNFVEGRRQASRVLGQGWREAPTLAGSTPPSKTFAARRTSDDF
eukprot:494859-Alexandrium_andersonii.AAC.1